MNQGQQIIVRLGDTTSFAILKSDFAVDEVDIWVIKSDAAAWISSKCDFLVVDSKCCNDCIIFSIFH